MNIKFKKSILDKSAALFPTNVCKKHLVWFFIVPKLKSLDTIYNKQGWNATTNLFQLLGKTH